MKDNPVYDDPVFEKGRQHALTDLKIRYTWRLHFLESIKDTKENMTYSIEKREGMIEVYKQILESIADLENWQKTRHLIAAQNPTQ